MASIPVSRIRGFIEKMEASLASPTDHRRWIRLLDPEYGETDEAAIAAHLIKHPEDGERLHWLQWIRTGVPRAREPVGERSVDYQLPAPEITATVPVAETKPAASPHGGATKPAPKSEESESEGEIVKGFGRRLFYGPSSFWP
jgi:hypothetical protein